MTRNYTLRHINTQPAKLFESIFGHFDICLELSKPETDGEAEAMRLIEKDLIEGLVSQAEGMDGDTFKELFNLGESFKAVLCEYKLLFLSACSIRQL